MSDVTIALPPPSIPKPHPPASVPKPHPPSSITTPLPPASVPTSVPSSSSIPKPQPPPIVTKGIKDKQKTHRLRQKFSPPTLPPPTPPTITPSPPPYSSISPPPSPLHLTVPSASQRQTPPRPPPPATAPPSSPPRPPPPATAPPSSPPPRSPSPPTPSAPPPESDHPPAPIPDQNNEISEVNGEVTVNASGDGEEEEEGGVDDRQESHYERAPISHDGRGIITEGGDEDSGPEYVNIDSLDEEGEEEEEEGGQPSRYSVARQNYENWDILEGSDSSDEDNNGTPHPYHHHRPTQSNPPTLPLNTHPVLMAKQGGGHKPKGKQRNRAPPPPPGVEKGVRKAGISKDSREQRKKEKSRETKKEETGSDWGRRREMERERERVRETERASERVREIKQEREKVRGAERDREEGGEEENTEEEEHDYSTIPRTNYINWEFEREDGSSESDDESSSATPKPKTQKPSNPPTLHLNTHPIFMKSHSYNIAVESANIVDGKRPKNRAPPPPPAKSKSKPPRGFSHQLSQPHTQVGEYARVTKPPPGHKRTKSDQQAVEESQQEHLLDKQQQISKDEQQQMPNDKQKQMSKDKQQMPEDDRQQKQQKSQQKLSHSGLTPNRQVSPLARHKNGEATPPLDHKGKMSVQTRDSEREHMARGRVGEGPAPRRPSPRGAGVGRMRHSAAELLEVGRGMEREVVQANVKRVVCATEQLMRPKRQAPPPPAARAASVDCTEDRTCRVPPQGAEALLAEKQNTDDVRVQTPPPKPKRLHRRTPPTVDIATEASPTTQESTEIEERQTSSSGTPRAENGQSGGLDRWERLIHKMEFFTINLGKEGDRSLGMVIVSGKVMNKDGSSVEGIFIQKILPGSLTDKDGRIQAGDMLVEINGVSMVGGSVELASKRLRDSKESVKLKVGRPDRGTFKVPGEDDKEEPIYVNSDDMDDSELLAKLDQAETRAAKMEELWNKADKELKMIREMADKEQKTFHKRLEEVEVKLETSKHEAQTKITDLTIALANITVDKTKLEKEVESLKSSQSTAQDGELTSLKRELKEAESEREMAERDLQQLREEMEASAGLQSRLSELESSLAHLQQDRDTVRRQLESTCHELSVAHATLAQMQREKTALEEENERTALELARERKPSAGRRGDVEAELAQQRRELTLLQRELQTLRDKKEKAETDVGEMRTELEREKERNIELEKKLESQQKTEKATTTDLLSRIQTQAKQMHDLKADLSKAKSEVLATATAVAVKEEQQGQTSGKEEEGGDTQTEKGVGRKQSSLDAAPVDSSPEHKHSQSPAQSELPPTPTKRKNTSDKTSSNEIKNRSPKETPHVATEDSISIEAFDDIKAIAVLDNTPAKDKSQVALRNAKKPRSRPSREHIRSMSVENLLSGFDEIIPTDTSPTEKIPVPRPRKSTMEKDSPVHKPLPIPRHLRSPVPLQNDPPQRPPKPSTDLERGAQVSPDRKVKLGRASPPHTRAPSPSPLLPPTSKTGQPPKPVPRRMNKRSEDTPSDEAQAKDPSQLTVKERMELAQKAIVKKPPPVVPKKPSSSRVHADNEVKSLSQPEGDESEFPMTRHSLENDNSPRYFKKLPPGAFNIGLMAMAPMGQSRPRSHTVATSREHSMERDDAEEYSEQMKMEEERDTEALKTDDIEIKFPPKRPPLPMSKRTSSNDKPALLSSRSNDALTEAVPPMSIAADSAETHTEEPDGRDVAQGGEYGTLPDPSSLDYSQVLSWTPVQVASWITGIGVSQYSSAFLDRGVQGNKLFDLDGSGLKAMGVSSPDDRALIKREIKALRPHAEKQKKVLEKQRKDDKRKKKRHFV